MKIDVYDQTGYCLKCTKYFSRCYVKDKPALPVIMAKCADCMTPAELDALKSAEPYFKYDKYFTPKTPPTSAPVLAMADARHLEEI